MAYTIPAALQRFTATSSNKAVGTTRTKFLKRSTKLETPALACLTKLSQQQLTKARKARAKLQQQAAMEAARLTRAVKKAARYAARTCFKSQHFTPRRKKRVYKHDVSLERLFHTMVCFPSIKPQRRGKPGPRLSLTLELVLQVLVRKRRPMDAYKAFLNKAQATRTGITDRVRNAVGGYTGTVVARLDPDVKRVSFITPQMENKEQQTGKPAWSMEAILKSKNLMCHLHHCAADGTNTASGDEYVVLLAAGLQQDGAVVPCNQNLPNGMFSDDQLGRSYRNGPINAGGVNTPIIDLGGAIGFRSAQLRVLSKDFLAAAVTNFPYAPKGTVPVQAIFASLVDGKPDWQTGNIPDGTIKEIRNTVMQLMLEGESAVLGDHGFAVRSYKGFRAVLQQPGMTDPSTGADTGRHFFIVVGRVWQRSNKPHESMRSGGKAQHWRFYCSEMAVLHIDPARVDSGELFGNTLNKVLHKDYTMPQILRLEREFNVQPAVQPVVQQPVVVTTTTPTVINPVVVSAEPTPLDNNLLEELIAYRNAFGIKGTPNSKRISAEQIGNDFNAVTNRAKALEIMQLLRTQQNSAACNVADATRWAIIQHLCDGDITQANSDNAFYALDISSREWTTEDVLELIRTIQLVGKRKGLVDLPTIAEVDGVVYLTFGKNGAEFEIVDNFVYKDSCMLLNSLEMVIAKKDEDEMVVVDLNHSSSLASLVKLIYFGYLPLLAQSYTSVMTNTAANFVEFCRSEFVGHLIKLSSHAIRDQNSGVLMRVTRTLDLIVRYEFNPFNGFRWVDLSANGRFAANLVKHYEEQAPKFDTRDVRKQAIEMAFRKGYYDLVFNKQQLVAGNLGHINMAAMANSAPELFAKLQAKYGVTTADVICLTLKATKGLKRVMLSLARAANVEHEVEAGYMHFEQVSPTTGALIKVAMAPTVTYTAGNSLWVGKEEDMPVATVNKKIGPYYVLDFPEDAKPVFDMGCTLKEGDFTMQQEGEWIQYIPNKEIWLEPNCVLCEVPKVSGGTSFVRHEANHRGVLKLLKYRFKNLLLADQQDMEFVWEYTIFEHHPKVRSVAKAMVNRASKALLYNSRNELDNIAVDLVHFQDGIKADTLYAWLTVLGTTLRYNWDHPDMANMRAMAKKINRQLGHPSFCGLVIESVSVALGVYDEIQKEFEQLFARPIWYRFADIGDTGRALLEMHERSGEYELVKAADNYKIFVSKGADYKDPAANATQFVFVDGVVTEVWQRGMTFIGRPDCPLYNIELFESTTVQENVTSSWQLPVNVTSATWFCNNGANPAALEQLRIESVTDLGPNVLRAKALAAMSLGAAPTGTQIMHINYVGAQGKSTGKYFLAKEDRQFLIDRIRSLNLNTNQHNASKNYKLVANALADITFVFEVRGKKTSIYLPVLYNLNSLSRVAGSNQTLSGMFYENMLRPLVNGHYVDAIVGQLVRGKLDALLRSAETPKMLKGRDKQTGRRIGMPNVPLGETWILYSEEPGSMYQEFKRYLRKYNIQLTVGTNEEVYGFNDRAPIASGWFSKLRVITHEENDKNYYQLGEHHMAVSPLAVYVDGGDCDGDNHNFAYSGGKELAGDVLTYDLVTRIRNEGMGADMLTEGSYFYDHFTRKSWAAATKTLNSACVKSAIRTHEQYIRYNMGAHVVQWKAVGAGYKFYMLGEHLIDIARAYKQAGIACAPLEFLQTEQAYVLVLATSEIYEVMLGGYSPAAERLYDKYLLPAIKKGKTQSVTAESIAAFSQLLKEYGGNAHIAGDLLRLLNLVAITQKLECNGKLPESVLDNKEYALAISAALFCFEIGRGRFKGFKHCFGTYNEQKEAARGHRAAMEYTYKTMYAWLLEGGAKAAVMDKSRVFSCLCVLFRHLAFELSLTNSQSWHEDFFSYFVPDKAAIEQAAQPDNNEPDTDGGTPVVLPKPQDPTPGGAVVSSVKEEHDKEHQEQEAAPLQQQRRVKSRVAAQRAAAPTPQQAESVSTTLNLTEDQQRALNYILEGRNTVVSGEAGTGKSFLLQHVRELYAKKGWKVVVTGSTGTSVMNVEGDGTFNSKLGLALGFTGRDESAVEADKIVNTARFSATCQDTLSLNGAHKGLLLIVDEISMVDTKLLAIANKVVRDAGIKVQWILFGDPGQCTPVKGELFFKDFVLEKGQERTLYSSFLKSGDFVCVGLKQVVRQANDKEFLVDLQQLRGAKGIGKTIVERFKTSLTEKPAEAIHAYYNNECVMRHNERETARMIAAGNESQVYKATVTVFNPSNRDRFLRHFNPIQEEMTLCVGMPVMVRKNIKDETHQLLAANGTVGTVKELGKDHVVINLRNGEEVVIWVEELEGPKLANNRKMGVFKQLPLHPAFAVTGHKLQGLTITEPLVVHPYQRVKGRKVPVNTTGWLYVACSRVTKADLLYFDVEHISDITLLTNSMKADPEALAWMEQLQS